MGCKEKEVCRFKVQAVELKEKIMGPLRLQGCAIPICSPEPHGQISLPTSTHKSLQSNPTSATLPAIKPSSHNTSPPHPPNNQVLLGRYPRHLQWNLQYSPCPAPLPQPLNSPTAHINLLVLPATYQGVGC